MDNRQVCFLYQGNGKYIMADVLSTEERKKNMSRIRGKDTKPEIYIRKILFSRGYRYRKNYSGIIGHPDIYLAKYRTAIFINGCFWHRHMNCRYAYMPKSRIEFWKKKFELNIARDQLVHEQLLEQGTKCLVIWECCIKKMRGNSEIENKVIQMIDAFLISDDVYMEIPREEIEI